ncbi:MAG: hypothetical protein JWM87_3888 [Candidatus Eremiobacteraeota bacterium]|nr:hypothetical protein [Candidatus Eremiobacteraeota bacterium]
MEHKASKLGTALAAAVLGLGLPAMASAQELPQSDEQPDTSATSGSVIEQANAPEMTTLDDAMASLGARTQSLANLGTISADDIAVVSVADMGLTAEQRYAMMQNADPSAEATLQRTLADVQVDESGSLAGYRRSLADHVTMLGIDPSSVVAVDVDGDGAVTLYYQ